jgi:hypothetical protein
VENTKNFNEQPPEMRIVAAILVSILAILGELLISIFYIIHFSSLWYSIPYQGSQL